jgi:hypothetical protein
MWRLLRAGSIRAGGAVAAVSLTSFALGRTPAQAEPTVEKRYAAAFLNSDGVATLHKTVPPKHKAVVDAPHMTIAYDPRGARLAQLATQLGRPVDLVVKAVVSDDHAQAVVVEVVKATEDDDGGVPYSVENTVPHVTVSVSQAHDGYGPFYGNHMLARALQAAGSLDKDWEGKLPARDGFEEVQCTITVPSEKTLLTATLCTSDHWDLEANRCGAEKECGFCRFMKLGPCGKEFAAWEQCIEKCKETEDDFVDKCASQTLVLKNCVDANPDYYYSVIDDKPDDAEASEEADAPSQKEESAPVNTTENAQSEEPASTIEVNPNATIEIDASATLASPVATENDDEDNYTTKG